MLDLRRSGDRIVVAVRVAPRSAANAIGEVREGALVLRVTAAPVDGEANEAVRALLARTLRVPRSEVRIERGAASRTKLVTLPASAEAALRRVVK